MSTVKEMILKSKKFRLQEIESRLSDSHLSDLSYRELLKTKNELIADIQTLEIATSPLAPLQERGECPTHIALDMNLEQMDITALEVMKENKLKAINDCTQWINHNTMEHPEHGMMMANRGELQREVAAIDLQIIRLALNENDNNI